MTKVWMVCLVLLSCGDDGAAQQGRFTVETIAEGLSEPVDAVLSPDGATVYYLTRGADGGLFEVSASGTRKLEDFAAAHALAISNDGRTIFIADDDEGIITLRPDGSLGRTNLPGTSGIYAPRLVARDELCFGAGSDVACVPLAGGATEVVVHGFPSNVSGVALTVGGRVFAETDDGLYAADPGRAPERLSAVTGTGGVALSFDEQQLIVAGLDAQLTTVARADGATVDVFDGGVHGNGHARCLQRAPQADVFMMCGDDAVYRLRPR